MSSSGTMHELDTLMPPWNETSHSCARKEGGVQVKNWRLALQWPDRLFRKTRHRGHRGMHLQHKWRQVRTVHQSQSYIHTYQEDPGGGFLSCSHEVSLLKAQPVHQFRGLVWSGACPCAAKVDLCHQ